MCFREYCAKSAAWLSVLPKVYSLNFAQQAIEASQRTAQRRRFPMMEAGLEQVAKPFAAVRNAIAANGAAARFRGFIAIFLPFALITGTVLLAIHGRYADSAPETLTAVTTSLLLAYWAILLISGIAALFLVWEQGR